MCFNIMFYYSNYFIFYLILYRFKIVVLYRKNNFEFNLGECWFLFIMY